MESPFFNAYLLDRLCRESITRHRRLQYNIEPVAEVESPAINPELEEPSVASDNKAQESDTMKPSQNEEIASEGPFNDSPTPEVARPSLISVWYASMIQVGQRSRQRLSEIANPSFIVGCIHDLFFPGAAKEPSFLSVLDRVHHLTTSLEPRKTLPAIINLQSHCSDCSDVDRLRSVYITVANFLNFIVHRSKRAMEV